MGIGGNLLASSIIRNLVAHGATSVIVAGTPRPSDLFGLRLYNKEISYENDAIFSKNPKITFPRSAKKNTFVSVLDKVIIRILEKLRLTNWYEKSIFNLSRKFGRKLYYYPDMAYLSYAQKVLPNRMIWKQGGHAIDIGLAQFGSVALDHQCEIYLTEEEKQYWAILAKELELTRPFIVVEPGTNLEWFGDLRSWPLERWQEIVKSINKKFANSIEVIQVGVKGSPVLQGVKSVVGKTTVRQTALILKAARLFMGTEGGLMHLANATHTPSVIIWGGLTLPEFAGYPELHSIICKYVDCAPCGLRGNCPYDKKCLNSISIEEAWHIISSLLSEKPL